MQVIQLHFRSLFSCYLILLSCVVIGQSNIPKNPNKLFSNGNYIEAIKGYSHLLKASPNDYDLNLNLAQCYLNSHTDKKPAIDLLEKIKGSDKNNFEVLYFLGKAYHVNYKFDKAIATYQMYIDTIADSLKMADTRRQIEMCKNAKVLLSNPVNVKLKNLGDTINSKAPDYNVFVDEDESILVYSSKRKKRNKAEGPSPDGYYTADIFVSRFENNAWQKPKVPSKVCTPSNEEIVGLSADGKLMFLNINGRGVTGDMTVSHRPGKSFKEPIKVEKTVNSSATEMTETVSHDRQTFYYASNRKGKGGFDIYQTKRLPTMEWGKSKLLEINSEYDELYPQLSPDEKTLYFISNGHSSMGGFDIFKSQWDSAENKWGEPQNMGFPINTPNDDMHFAINKDGSIGYISTYRKDSRGDLDIYSVQFKDIEARRSIIRGHIITQMPIDYSNDQFLNVYAKNGKEIQIPKEFTMTDSTWELTQTIKIALQPHMKFNTILKLYNVSDTISFQSLQLPEHLREYKIIDATLTEVSDSNFAHINPFNTFGKFPVHDAVIEVYDENNEIVGIYNSNATNGRFVMALPPGTYQSCLASGECEQLKEKITIPGQSSFQPIINKNFEMKYSGPHKPASFRKLHRE